MLAASPDTPHSICTLCGNHPIALCVLRPLSPGMASWKLQGTSIVVFSLAIATGVVNSSFPRTRARLTLCTAAYVLHPCHGSVAWNPSRIASLISKRAAPAASRPTFLPLPWRINPLLLARR